MIFSESKTRTYSVFFCARGVHDRMHSVFITYRKIDTNKPYKASKHNLTSDNNDRCGILLLVYRLIMKKN